MEKVAKQWEKLIKTLRKNDVVLRENTYDKWIYDEVYVNNVYEINDLNPDDVVIDIGSHCGYFSKLCLDNGSQNVVCYEANEENYQLLLKNLSSYSGWKAHNVAVWKETSNDVSFYNYNKSDNTGLNSFYKSPYMNDYEVTKVKTVSLNDVLSSYEKVKILKLDTEGAEYEILMNSTSLEKVETILGEYHNDLTDKTLSDLIKFLESKNFIIYNTVRFNETSGLFFATHQSKMKEKTISIM